MPYANPEDRRAARRRYYAQNREKVLDANSRWSKANFYHKSAAREVWRLANAGTYRASKLRWQRENRAASTAVTAHYRAAKDQRTPSWANLRAIKQFYLDCPVGMAVDHIIPLRGKMASGLHVETNLQYLSRAANSAKGNRFEVGEIT